MRSLVVRLNPLVLFAFGLFSLIGSLFVRDLTTAAWAVGAYAAAALLFLPSWRYPVVCLLLSAVAAATIVYSTWRLGGRDEQEALTAGLRILVLAWPGSVMLGYLDPARLGDYLAQSLRLPARMVAAFSAALQRFLGFHLAWQQLDRVRRARGFGAGRNPFANGPYVADMSFALLVQALRGASASSIAMDARGFATAHDRTWAEPATWSGLDRAAIALAALLGAVPVVVHLV
ncbi:energy-coupling factor transporter transmembrane component T [Aeromicrobium wangtongii]|uniref:energy-coupling factor transporter transmembrane component T n=1 Tax=Aeromicrobium wangtongii TaxID=2969247 RepID=UPI0020180017|nr:energy-coupling factor transporter transmembrane component T [Aeromicrobium wangtongii]MCL3816902.1 energy-coupling factor transporter transmembrane protein EcfT [Aeromicrobium wangtongii]